MGCVSTRAIRLPAGIETVALGLAEASWVAAGESGGAVVCWAKALMLSSSVVVKMRACVILVPARWLKGRLRRRRTFVAMMVLLLKARIRVAVGEPEFALCSE